MTLHSLCLRRLTLACISSEISTKLLGMPTHPDWPSLIASGPYLMPTGLFCCPVSTALLRLPSPIASLWVPLSNSFWPSLAYFRSRRDLELRPLFGFAPNQTKRSSAWRTLFIVSHLNGFKHSYLTRIIQFSIKSFVCTQSNFIDI